MSKKSVVVGVDSREPPEIFGPLESHPEIETWYIDEFTAGDLLVTDPEEVGGDSTGVIIERKEPSDFASSIQDGRLMPPGQVSKLENSPHEAFILIEGSHEDLKDFEHTEMSYSSLLGVKSRIQISHDVQVELVGGSDDGDVNTANLIDTAVSLGRKHIEEASEPGLIPSSVEDLSQPTHIRVFGCVTGVGPSTARDLGEHFPSVQTALDATVDELTGVPGVGEKTAQNIKEELR